jgi:hypothetical protein
MTKTVWVRCLVVSLIIAAFAPGLSMVVIEDEVIDLSAIQPGELSNISEKELAERVTTLPTRRVRGIERFTYPYTHPQIGLFYLRAAVTWFVGLFVATVVVSYLNSRKGVRT